MARSPMPRSRVCAPFRPPTAYHCPSNQKTPAQAVKPVAINASSLPNRSTHAKLDPLWDELFPTEQARVVALLVERVDIGADGLSVRLRVDGLNGLAREMLAGRVERAA